MYLKIGKVKVVKGNYGNNMLITHLGLYDDNGKWVKWIKMDEYVSSFIVDFPILMNGEDLEKLNIK